MTRAIFVLIALALPCLVAACGPSTPPAEEVTATWTEGDDAPLTPESEAGTDGEAGADGEAGTESGTEADTGAGD